MNYEPGRIVTLKSGGPPLTVVDSHADTVRCIWFAHADDRLQEALIPAACLDFLSEEDMRGDFNEEGDSGPQPSGRHAR
ncbi:MAG: YodC family protein [Beijerinckiaceae bacterium]